MIGLLGDFVNSPAFGLLIAAVLAEWRASRRAREARRERREFREELAALAEYNDTGH